MAWKGAACGNAQIKILLVKLLEVGSALVSFLMYMFLMMDNRMKILTFIQNSVLLPLALH